MKHHPSRNARTYKKPHRESVVRERARGSIKCKNTAHSVSTFNFKPLFVYTIPIKQATAAVLGGSRPNWFTAHELLVKDPFLFGNCHIRRVNSIDFVPERKQHRLSGLIIFSLKGRDILGCELFDRLQSIKEIS